MNFKYIVFLLVFFPCFSYSEEKIYDIKLIKKDFSISNYDFDVSEEKKNDFRNLINKSVLGDYSKSSLDSISNRLSSDDWNDDLSRYRNEIAKKMNIEVSGDDINIIPKDKVMVFISKSIPLETLRAYARDLEKIGGVFVMRGMVDGLTKVRPQALFSADVLKLDKDCKVGCKFRATEILVDPIMFKKYNIRKVPAVVVQSGLDFFDYCHSKDKFAIEKTIVYGDSSLKYIISRYAEEDKRDSIKKYLGFL